MGNAEALEESPPHPLWWAAIGYAGLAAFGWLFVTIERFLRWRTYTATAQQIADSGNAQRANEIQVFAGTLVTDLVWCLATAAVFAFVGAALLRRSWNAWDYATVVLGIATLISTFFFCARDRVMFFMPLTLAPLLGLIYLRNVRVSSGVQVASEDSTTSDGAPITPVAQQDIERELARERTLVNQLRQNLNVFEIERGITTDTFVERYARGVEEETPDNAEWFSIARAVRRGQERIAELQAQLADQPNDDNR